MTRFENSRWADRDYAYQYLDEADIRIIERRRLLEILKSYYRHFLGKRKNNRILDLGCGDGILTDELLQVDNSISPVLIDASGDMLRKAKERLRNVDGAHFIQASFQDLIKSNTEIQLSQFGGIVSSLSIHHLNSSEKEKLFAYILDHLIDGGCFINIDIVLSPTMIIESWYRDLWREWMVEHRNALQSRGSFDYDAIIKMHAEEGHFRKIDTLSDQLDMLQNVGFRDVDCFYKYGLFAMYGGRK